MFPKVLTIFGEVAVAGRFPWVLTIPGRDGKIPGYLKTFPLAAVKRVFLFVVTETIAGRDAKYCVSTPGATVALAHDVAPRWHPFPFFTIQPGKLDTLQKFFP